MTFYIIPLVIFIIFWIWFIITFFYNSLIIPLLWFPASYNLTLDKWVFLALIVVIIYYLFFTKKIEWEKFKLNRDKYED